MTQLIGPQGTVSVIAGSESDLESSPPPSPLFDTMVTSTSRVPTVIDPAPQFNLPSAPPSVAGRVKNTRATGPSQRVPTFGWILILSCATMVSIAAIMMVMTGLCSYYGHDRRYVEADEVERLDKGEENCGIPGTIVISHCSPPERYSRLDDEIDPSDNTSTKTSLASNVPPAIHFRAPPRRGFERLESERVSGRCLSPIPEDRSLGDLSTVCNEDYIFEDETL